MITKSTYVKYVTCHKRYYLNYHHKELSEVSKEAIARLETGNEVGDLAMGLFGDFTEVTTKKADGSLDLKEMTRKTSELILKGEKNICEASFIHDGLYCAVDILHQEKDGYGIYEVKSSTAVEDYYLVDSSFQRYVLEACGIKVTSVNIVILDTTYVRVGDLNLQKLFKIINVDEKVNKEVLKVHDNILKIKELQKKENLPASSINKKCFSPYKCEFLNYCLKDYPKPSVLNLVKSQKKYNFIKEGIISYEDLKKSPHYQKLTTRNKLQVDYELDKDLKPLINYDHIEEFLNKITYPLYLLDFETMQTPIPLYDYTRPYEQIPFQYSLHILDEDGKLEHKEFLAEEGTNPLRAIAESLIKDIPDNVLIMAYNMGFEKSRIFELSKIYPDLKDELIKRHDNFIDLMEPFSKCDFYLKAFEGSYSIKYVLPALFPNDEELNYHHLNLVHNGGEAMTIYKDLLKYSKKERLEIREALLRYCELDTYAMVKILNKLKEIVKNREL